MSESVKTTVKKFLLNPGDKSAKSRMAGALMEKIVHTITMKMKSGSPVVRCLPSEQRFVLKIRKVGEVASRETRPGNGIDGMESFPEMVAWRHVSKDFSEAFVALVKDLMDKIEKGSRKIRALLPIHPGEPAVMNAVKALEDEKQKETLVELLTGDQESWILGALALTLNNEVFVEEIQRYQRKKRKMHAAVKKLFKGAAFSTCDELADFIGASFNDEIPNVLASFKCHEIAGWALLNAGKPSGDVQQWIRAKLSLHVDETSLFEMRKRIDDKLTPFLMGARPGSEKGAILKGLRRVFKGREFSRPDEIRDFIHGSFSDEIFKAAVLNFKPRELASWALHYALPSGSDIIRWIRTHLDERVDESDVRKSRKAVNEKLKPLLAEFFHDADDVAFESLERTWVDSEGSRRKNVGDEARSEAFRNRVARGEDPLDIQFEIALEEDGAPEFTDAGDLISRKRLEEVIALQKEALFWTPGKPFNGKRLAGRGSRRAVYAGFFYSWLRRGSGASWPEIGRETDSALTGPFRHWRPNAELAEPFPDISFSREDGVYPVFLDESARSVVGLYDSRIRCFPGPFHGAEYEAVCRKKKILCAIYDQLRDGEELDDIKLSAVDDAPVTIQRDDFEFSFDIALNADIGIHANKNYCLVFVRRIKEYEHDASP